MTDMLDARNRQRLLELLPFYINGQIAPEDRAWVESMVQEHPVARAELEFHRGMAAEVREHLEAMPADVGMDRLMQRVRGETRPATLFSAPARPGLADRLRDFLYSLTARPAWALAAAVMLVQAGFIATLLQRAPQDEFSTIRSAGKPAATSPDTARQTILAMTFKGDASERDIRLLLLKLEGSLVGGPGQLGEYLVAVPATRADVARKEAEASGIVEAILLARPERTMP